MNVTSVSLGVFIVLFTILLLQWVRKPRPLVSAFRSQRMCPSCGLITARRSLHCLECGKRFTTVE